ncbi:MAG: endolytic transglycosylase MltG [Pseudomonadota bacterium]
MLKRIFLLLVVLIVGVAALIAFDVSRFLNAPLAAQEREFELHIKQGDTIRGIAAQLNQSGLLSRPLWWELFARYNGSARSIKTGEYPLNSSITPVELLEQLQVSKQKQFAFTILEGWNIWQLRDALSKNDVLVQTIQNVADDALLEFIGAAAGHPEGQFLPDTYHFPRGTSDADFLLRAHNAMTAKLAQVWDARSAGLPAGSPYEVMIMASIIEKETSVESERETISGVIANRLRKGMRLQMDPTVIYGIGPGFNGNITRKDLQTKTAYNTYKIDGLPPTPIAMPSARSLEAAVNPADTKALYFVADGTGGHVFNETVEAHNKAVRKYILKK